MDKENYDIRFVIDDLDPYLRFIIEEHKFDMSKMNQEVPSELNILNILKKRIIERFGLDCSEFYFDATIHNKKIVLEFKYVPSGKVDIKPSEFRSKVVKTLEDIGSKFKKKEHYGVRDRVYDAFQYVQNRLRMYKHK